ncbi:MAG: hypothetical protein JKY34_00045 [Kordiimonadaceae bacterium]|nr:hypothetical protein [Kordiimonadaceae bacterium]
MPEKDGVTRPVVQDILDILLTKFEELPIDDRDLAVVACIEAIAWIAAMEAGAYAAESGKTRKDAHDRFGDYNYLFTVAGNIRLSSIFSDNK